MNKKNPVQFRASKITLPNRPNNVHQCNHFMPSKECVLLRLLKGCHTFFIVTYRCARMHATTILLFPCLWQCDIDHVFRRRVKTLILNRNRCVRVRKDDFMESHTRTHTIKWDWSYYMRSVPKYLSILLQAPKEHSNSHSHKKLFDFYIAKVNMGSLNRTHKHTQICILSSCYHRTFSVNLQQKGVSMTWHWMELVKV